MTDTIAKNNLNGIKVLKDSGFEQSGTDENKNPVLKMTRERFGKL